MVKIISTKDLKSQLKEILQGMCRHVSGMGPGACLILLIHRGCRPPHVGHTGSTTWVLSLPGEMYVYPLFCSMYSFPFVFFTNHSLDSSFLKYWIKPWVFMALHLEQLKPRWAWRGDRQGGWGPGPQAPGVCNPAGMKAVILANVHFTIRANRLQSKHQCRLILANLAKNWK